LLATAAHCRSRRRATLDPAPGRLGRAGAAASARDPAAQGRNGPLVHTAGARITRQQQPGPRGKVAQGPANGPCALTVLSSAAGEQGAPQPAERVTAQCIDGAHPQKIETARLQQGQQPWNGAGVPRCSQEDPQPLHASCVRPRAEQASRNLDRTRRRCRSWRAQSVREHRADPTCQLLSASSPAAVPDEPTSAGLVENGGHRFRHGLFSCSPLIPPGAGAIMSPGQPKPGTHNEQGQAEQQHDRGRQARWTDEGHHGRDRVFLAILTHGSLPLCLGPVHPETLCPLTRTSGHCRRRRPARRPVPWPPRSASATPTWWQQGSAGWLAAANGAPSA